MKLITTESTGNLSQRMLISVCSRRVYAATVASPPALSRFLSFPSMSSEKIFCLRFSLH